LIIIVGTQLITFNNILKFWFSTITIDGTKKGEKWPEFNTGKCEYVLINTSIPLIKEKPYVDEYEFWNSLPLLSGLNEARASDKTELLLNCIYTRIIYEVKLYLG